MPWSLIFECTSSASILATYTELSFSFFKGWRLADEHPAAGAQGPATAPRQARPHSRTAASRGRPVIKVSKIKKKKTTSANHILMRKKDQFRKANKNCNCKKYSGVTIFLIDRDIELLNIFLNKNFLISIN
jgi:hypothetical protein